MLCDRNSWLGIKRKIGPREEDQKRNVPLHLTCSLFPIFPAFKPLCFALSYQEVGLHFWGLDKRVQCHRWNSSWDIGCLSPLMGVDIHKPLHDVVLRSLNIDLYGGKVMVQHSVSYAGYFASESKSFVFKHQKCNPSIPCVNKCS